MRKARRPTRVSRLDSHPGRLQYVGWNLYIRARRHGWILCRTGSNATRFPRLREGRFDRERRGLFFEAVEHGDEGGGAAFEVAYLLAEDFAIGVCEDEGGEAVGAEFFLEVGVLVLDFLRELFGLGKVNEHEDEVFAGVGFEFFGVEDFFVHFDAPWAPV